MSKENSGIRRGPGGHGSRMAPGEKAKDFKGTMKKLLKELNAFKIGLIAVLIAAIASAAFSIVGPKILGKVTTKIFEGIVDKLSGTGTGIDFDAIGKILLFLIGLYIVSALFQLMQSYIMSGVSQKMCYNLRTKLISKVNRMPMNYFESRTNGEILSRFTNDIDTLGQSLNQSVTQLITSVTTVIGILIMMLSISVQMTLVALLVLPVSGVLIGMVVKRSQKYFKSQQEYLGHVNGQVEEVYGGHNIVKVFNREKKSIEEFDKMNGKLYESAWKSQFLSGLMMPIITFVGNLGYVGVSIMGGWLAIKKTIEVGDFVFDASNKPSKVLGISSIKLSNEMYKIIVYNGEKSIEIKSDEIHKFPIFYENDNKDIKSTKWIYSNYKYHNLYICGKDEEKWFVEKVKKIENELVRCIQVKSESHLFLITDKIKNDWFGGEKYSFDAILTHNTGGGKSVWCGQVVEILDKTSR